MERIKVTRIPVSTLTDNIVVVLKITGMRRFKVRTWVGLRVMKLAAFIMGMKFEVEVK